MKKLVKPIRAICSLFLYLLLVDMIKYIQLLKSRKEDKKFEARFFDIDKKKIKSVNFGAKGMSDFTKHKDEERKQRYLNRHEKNENWNDPLSRGALSRWILWNKPTLSASYNDYLKKFNLLKY